MTQGRRSLSDILGGVDRHRLSRVWDEADAADEFGAPLPAGEYVARVVRGDLSTSRRKQTPCYHLTFRVLEGEHAGRLFWLDCWLTEAAIPQSKRDLAKLGVSSLDQLERPLPQGIRVRARLIVQTDDNGNKSNRVRSFEVIGIDKIEADPFAPDDGSAGGGEHGDF